MSALVFNILYHDQVQDKDGLASAGAIHALATCSGPQAVIRTLAELVMLRE